MNEQPTSYTLLFPDELVELLERHYKGLLGENPSPYVTTFVNGDGFTISAFSKLVNGYYRVLFQGKKAKNEAEKWIRKGAIYDPKRNEGGDIKIPAKPKATSIPKGNKFPQLGSDEVGTGDYFGPITVCAAYVEEKDLDYLKELGITDSKKMTDDRIKELGPILIKKFKYSLIALNNEKYNAAHAKGININKMKAKLHNKVLLKLSKQYPDAHRYMDQFAAEGLYYSYLKEDREVVRNITFSTKGELHYPCVALASVIARYAFLALMDELSKKVGVTLPFGASNAVENFARNFLKSHSIEELDAITKADFATRKKVLG
ncbi:MAG: ribonuclease HIII [Bacilli bacterium]|nr:ribonuclease HIII [Bacilli bacterium]